MSASEHLSQQQFPRTLHRGMRVVVPTAEIQPHLDRGDHEAAADVVLNRVLNYQEDRPRENAVGRFGGLGTHWTDNRDRASRTFAGKMATRDNDTTLGDDMQIPVVLRGVVHPEAIDHAPPAHRALFDYSVENEVHVRSGAPVSLRSAHVRLPESMPAMEEILPGMAYGESPGSHVIKRRMNKDVQA
jgi:hypothetical protein